MQKKRVDTLVESLLNKTPIITEAESTSDSKADDAFDLLDDARKSLQDAQANIYIKMPSIYQQLYKDQLATIYNHAHNAIAEVQKLAKQMHLDLNQ